jgi:hypothetical protein
MIFSRCCCISMGSMLIKQYMKVKTVMGYNYGIAPIASLDMYIPCNFTLARKEEK